LWDLDLLACKQLGLIGLVFFKENFFVSVSGPEFADEFLLGNVAFLKAVNSAAEYVQFFVC
jgi:hypothetical protein